MKKEIAVNLNQDELMLLDWALIRFKKQMILQDNPEDVELCKKLTEKLNYYLNNF